MNQRYNVLDVEEIAVTGQRTILKMEAGIILVLGVMETRFCFDVLQIFIILKASRQWMMLVSRTNNQLQPDQPGSCTKLREGRVRGYT